MSSFVLVELVNFIVLPSIAMDGALKHSYRRNLDNGVKVHRPMTIEIHASRMECLVSHKYQPTSVYVPLCSEHFRGITLLQFPSLLTSGLAARASLELSVCFTPSEEVQSRNGLS